MRQTETLTQRPSSESGRRSPLALCGSEILPCQTYASEWGILLNGDCLKILSHIRDSTIDTVYSLLYYKKGKPKAFRRIRTPIQTCRHCSGEIRDYGGHRNAMNPKGVNLTDLWDDIPPVRHWKFKSKKRTANQLST
jgi:hypothetical protein